jgi:hypothetical protein
MNQQQNGDRGTADRRIRVQRRPRRREVYDDTTVTDSWPPRLNIKL